jgi:release factor glutamine methyltransferase
MGEVYRPAEDSYLLAKNVSRLVYGEVLDIGTGSGIQAVTAAKKREVISVVAADVNPKALIEARKAAERDRVSEKIKFIESDLFTSVRGTFDWIIFNPPYLPSEGESDELTWAGGKDGTEIINMFLLDASDYLKKNGSILMVFSSHTNEDSIKYEGYNLEILEEKNVFFETLYCIRFNRI